MLETLRRHTNFWRKLGTAFRARINRQRVEPLSSQNLSDKGLNADVTMAVANSMVSAMAQRVGVDPLEIAADSWLKDDITRECTRCTNRGKCRLWLADYEADGDGYKEFCSNADKFQKLM